MAVSFLDAFEPSHRTLLEGAAQKVVLRRGAYLLRRGEPGGDVFLLQAGVLEVVDSRSTPEVILNALRAGAVVGEMAFIDDAPRSADVRSATECTVLRWGRDDLSQLLRRHPGVSAAFYEWVARMATARIRVLTDGAVAGAFGKAGEPPDTDGARDWAHRIVVDLKEALQPLETALRQAPEDATIRARVRSVLDHLEVSVGELFAAHRDPATSALAATQLRREVHPYLVRAAMMDRALRRGEGEIGTAELMAHLLVDLPGGDGVLGEVIDRWLLDRPSFAAIRAMQAPIVDLVRRLLPPHRSRRLTLINASTGSLAARIDEALRAPPTTLTVLDQSRAALSLLDIEGSAGGVELHTVQENLVRFASGRSRLRLPMQDAIVLHGLIEFLPERLAVSLLAESARLLSADSVLVLATLGPSRDQAFLDRLLGWPTIRRSADAIDNLLSAAGYQTVSRIHVDAPGQLVVALSDEETKIKSFPVSSL